jgi:hypothetical protein
LLWSEQREAAPHGPEADVEGWRIIATKPMSASTTSEHLATVMDPAITPKRATCGSSSLAARGQLPFGNTGEIGTLTSGKTSVNSSPRTPQGSVKAEIEVSPFLAKWKCPFSSLVLNKTVSLLALSETRFDSCQRAAPRFERLAVTLAYNEPR